MTLSYLVALLAGMMWGVGFSGVLGAVAGLFGWFFLTEYLSPGYYSDYFVMLLSIFVIGLSLIIMLINIAFFKARAYNIKNLRIAATVYVFLLIGVMYFGSGIDTAADGHYDSTAACESQRFGKVAYVTTGPSKKVRTGFRTRERNIQTLHMADIDGRNSKTVAKGYWAYPLLWAPNGEMIYTVSIGNRYITRLCSWSIHTGRTRIITDLPIISSITNMIPTIDSKGNYLAISCEKHSIVSNETLHELWIVNLQTGMKRLACPNIAWESNLFWRDRKLYVREQGNWLEISPEGDLPHHVPALPGGKGDEQI